MRTPRQLGRGEHRCVRPRREGSGILGGPDLVLSVRGIEAVKMGESCSWVWVVWKLEEGRWGGGSPLQVRGG